MKKVVLVFGTRPEAIKMAPLIRELKADPRSFQPCVVVTGQHRDLLHPVLEFFGIRADHDLDLMTPDQSLPELTGRILTGLGPVLEQERPDLVVVQGDTTTTMTAALAAFYRRIPVAHLEAGLRTHQRYAPYPEEINRTLVGALASYHFAPTPRAAGCLEREGVTRNVWVVGNTAIDALLWAHEILQAGRTPLPGLDGIPRDPGRRLVLVTLHRRESFGAPMRALCVAIRDLAARRGDLEFLIPVHPNPRVREVVQAVLGSAAGVHLTGPLDYPELVAALTRCHLVMTDSGGIQEEAPTLGKPVLVLREVTERTEGIAAGTARLIGTDPGKVVAALTVLMDDPREYAAMAQRRNPYGDGTTGRRVAALLAQAELSGEGA